VAEGTTENKAVCTRLVSDLADRGLDTSRGVLFVVDGGKALERAIRTVFGRKALIQRCRQHKERNILDHLPEAERPLVQRRLRAAWALADADQAHAELTRLARSLDRQRPGAAASLREGLAETLTVTRLGVGGKLLQTVESTNPMESMIEIIRDHAGRVKRWSSGEMALRWAAAGMLAAQDPADVLVSQPVIGNPAGLAPADDAVVAQQPQLMAGGRLAAANGQRQITDTQLLGEAQGMQDLGPGGVGQHREHRREALGFGGSQDLGRQWLDDLWVQTPGLAPLRRDI
jgi:mutator family transposase